MRSREVWLLEQIDLVQQLKGEALQAQLHQLHLVSINPGVCRLIAGVSALHCVCSETSEDQVNFCFLLQ